MFPAISFVGGVNPEKRMWDYILYVVNSSDMRQCLLLPFIAFLGLSTIISGINEDQGQCDVQNGKEHTWKNIPFISCSVGYA
jgi:hypothetical protein